MTALIGSQRNHRTIRGESVSGDTSVVASTSAAEHPPALPAGRRTVARHPCTPTLHGRTRTTTASSSHNQRGRHRHELSATVARVMSGCLPSCLQSRCEEPRAAVARQGLRSGESRGENARSSTMRSTPPQAPTTTASHQRVASDCMRNTAISVAAMVGLALLGLLASQIPDGTALSPTAGASHLEELPTPRRPPMLLLPRVRGQHRPGRRRRHRRRHRRRRPRRRRLRLDLHRRRRRIRHLRRRPVILRRLHTRR